MIGIYVPTRGEVFCETADRLTRMALKHDLPLPTYVRGKADISDVRNRIVQQFLETEARLLVMCDADVVPPPHALDDLLLKTRTIQVLSGVCLIVQPQTIHLPNVFLYNKRTGNYEIEMAAYGASGLVEADAVGAGFIAIRREVLTNRHMKAPFAARYDKQGRLECGEDINFCRRAKAAGYTIAANMDVFCEHFVPTHANAVAQAYTKQIETLLDLKEGEDATALALP